MAEHEINKRRLTATKLRLALTSAVLVLLAAASLAERGQAGQDPVEQDGESHIVHVRGNVYMLAGAGGNIAASVGPDGVLLVDSGTAQASDAVIAAIRSIQEWVRIRNALPSGVAWGAETRSTVLDYRNPPAPDKPIRYIINTSVAEHHTGGNEKLSASGATYVGGNIVGPIAFRLDGGDGATIMAHESVLFRMLQPSGDGPAVPLRALPTETYYGDGMKLSHHFNGEGIQILHQAAAHTDGDSLVWFRGADVIVAGDIFRQDVYPVIDIEKGGSIQGVIDGLNRILELAIPEFRTEGGTMVIPGHGRLSDSADVGYYRDMVTIIRDHIREMMSRGMTLEQVKAARPTRAYDPRFGATTGPWTTDMFVEAVYRSLRENQ